MISHSPGRSRPCADNDLRLHLALELADKVYIMTKGRVVYEGLPEELAGDDRTKEEQLGIGGDQGPDLLAGQP